MNKAKIYRIHREYQYSDTKLNQKKRDKETKK